MRRTKYHPDRLALLVRLQDDFAKRRLALPELFNPNVSFKLIPLLQPSECNRWRKLGDLCGCPVEILHNHVERDIDEVRRVRAFRLLRW